MRAYENKDQLKTEILKRSKLFIEEFSGISDKQKDILVDGVDRTPAQMIAYQLGWMNLLLDWEKKEQQGIKVQTPSEDFKWNNLGGLYDNFYDTYADLTINQLIEQYNYTVSQIIGFIETLSDYELFMAGGRNWAASTPANWPVWKWIHINTVAPFQTFRTKIRKWKKLNDTIGGAQNPS